MPRANVELVTVGVGVLLAIALFALAGGAGGFLIGIIGALGLVVGLKANMPAWKIALVVLSSIALAAVGLLGWWWLSVV